MARELSSIRIARLKKLLLLLHRRRGQGVEAEEILRECEYASRRTLQADLQMLREEYGAEIEFTRTQPCRYCLKSEGDFLLPLALDERDVLSLTAGLGMAAHFLPHIQENCHALWRKMQAILPEKSVEFGRWLAKAAVVATPVSAMDAGVFEALLDAIYQKTMVEIAYVSPYAPRDTSGKREVRTHILAPWGVFFRAHAWYLLAGKEGKDKPGVFRLSRIQAARPCPDLPFLSPPEAFSQENFAASAWYAAPGELEHDIRLRVVEPMATIVSETVWHPTQRTERIDADTLILTARVPDLGEVARWVLSAAPYIAVESPLELRDMVRGLAAKMLELNSLLEEEQKEEQDKTP